MFEDRLHHLKLLIAEPTPNYYSILLSYANTITQWVHYEGQAHVAKELNIGSQPTVSAFMKLLTPLSEVLVEIPFIYYIELENGNSIVGVTKRLETRLDEISKANYEYLPTKTDCNRYGITRNVFKAIYIYSHPHPYKVEASIKDIHKDINMVNKDRDDYCKPTETFSKYVHKTVLEQVEVIYD